MKRLVKRSNFLISQITPKQQQWASRLSTSMFCLQYRSMLHTRFTDQAARISNPCPEFPATGPPVDPASLEAEGGVSKNPCIVWREHWCLGNRKPYYHHLLSNDVTWIRPKDFPSRFPWYWRRVAWEDPSNAIQAATSSGEENPEESVKELKQHKEMTLMEKVKAYGGVGAFLYMVLHFGCMFVIWCVLEAGVDLSGLLRRLGFNVDKEKPKSDWWAKFIVAVAINKIFVPFQMLGTLWLAPRLAPPLRRLYYYIML